MPISIRPAAATDLPQMVDYCRQFAGRGYVCFAIDYRFAPEAPLPTISSYSEDVLEVAKLNHPALVTDANAIRQVMGIETSRSN